MRTVGRCRRSRRLMPAQVFSRVGDKLAAAARAAEIVGLTGVLGAMLGRGRVDAHAAHRILCGVTAGGRFFRGLSTPWAAQIALGGLPWAAGSVRRGAPVTDIAHARVILAFTIPGGNGAGITLD